MNETIDPFNEVDALVCNFLALECLPSTPISADVPHSFGETQVYVQVGVYLAGVEKNKLQRHPVHLAHTFEFGALIHANTQQLIQEFRWDQHILTLWEEKRALVFQCPDQMGVLQIRNEDLFQRLKQNIDLDGLLPLEEVWMGGSPT